MSRQHNTSLLTSEVQEMSRKLVLYGLIVVCLTLLAFTWMVRGSLCEIRVQQGDTEFAAFLNYEVRD